MKRMSLLFLGLLVSVSSLSSIELKWGAAWRQGMRDDMQDAHILNLQQSRGVLFGIFDGHGQCCEPSCGCDAGRVVAEKVADYISAYGYSTPLATVLKNAEKLLKKDHKANCAGTTVLLSRIEGEALHVNWSGDSRVVVFNSKGKIKFESADHTWWNPQEAARAEKLGVEIVEWPEGVRRVAGMMPARTLGDFYAKEDARGALISDSQYAKVSLKPGDVIVMACDGLWDVFSSSDLVKYYRDLTEINGAPTLPHREEEGTEGDLSSQAWQLRDAAYRLDSSDNISVIVIEVN